jgi:hypothetical protein
VISLISKVCFFKWVNLYRYAAANCLPTHVESWSGLYDLKGSADDKAGLYQVKSPVTHSA